MKYIVSAPRSQAARRLLAGGALMGVLLAAGAAAIGDVSPEAKRSGAAASRSLSLFAGPKLRLSANQWECGLDSEGNVCTDIFNSPTGNGGNWPIGTPNGYIFNTGMQIGGISADGDYAWANDTLGAFFFDATGNRPSGSQVTNIYNSLDPADLCGDADGDGYDDCWGQADYDPSASFPTLDDFYVTDPDIYQENLLGRANISQQDSWVQYWDGDPTRITARQHPMGILITQRSLAWNYPLGNESILYFIYNLRNVTNTPEFQLPNELAFFSGDPAGIPDEGITFNEVYAGFSTDMDVADAGSNFSTAVLPFDLGISYHGGFDAPAFAYSPSIFFPPFFTTAPGIVGVKYLRSPIDPATGEEVGLTRFSITLNGGPPGSVDDPQTDKQLWRYHSGFLNPILGDAPCSVAPEVDTGQIATSEQSVCFVFQTPFDTRFFQSSGPFTLEPGQEATVVVAYLAAATVETMPDGTLSGIVANADPTANPPGTPSFHPGFPSARGCDASGNNCSVVNAVNPVKPLERGAGWAEYTGPAPSGRADGALEGPENKLPLFDEAGTPYVQTVQGSLLGKALVAQTIFDNKFLLGFAPIQPTSYTVPGNNSVTVLWERSLTEEIGDPFFEVAGDSASALYNPNYRFNDVEAYAVWRSVGQEAPQVIAFFDYANTTYVDVTCETVLPDDDLHDYSSAPTGTIGFAAGETCPEDFVKSQSINQDMYFNNGSIGGGPGGGVVRLADSTALGVALLQVGVDNFEAYPGLVDTGIPFAFNDLSVTNNFTYFYGVQAVDINSLASGPYSLASSRILSRSTPNNDTQNLDFASPVETFIAGDDGAGLDPEAPFPTIDSETGIFSGPMPPTDGMAIDLAPDVPRLQGAFEIEARIDSFMADDITDGNPTECVGGEYGFRSSCGVVHLTVGGEQVRLPIFIPNWYEFRGDGFTNQPLALVDVPFDPTALESFGIPEGSGSQGLAVATQNDAIEFINWEGQQNRRGRGGNSLHGGARWFSGTEETTPDPTAYIKVGHLDEVDSVWAPIHHTAQCNGCGALPNSGSVQYFGYVLAGLGRAADFQVTWSGGGISVRDVTHNVDVPFSSNVGSSWGFLNADPDGDGVTSWWDFFCIDNIKVGFEGVFGEICPGSAPLEATATIHPIALNTEGDPTTGSTADGFTLVLNAMRFFFVANATPPDGTVWTLRSYSGVVTTTQGADTDDPSGYAYLPVYDDGGGTDQRPAIIPGMSINWVSSDATTVDASWDLSLVHTVPDPYLATSQYDLAPTSKNLMFVNLPPKATIRIYTLTGVLVNQIDHEDSTGGGRAVWDVRNWSQQFVASGVYFYHVVTPEGDERVGKFTIVNFAGQN